MNAIEKLFSIADTALANNNIVDSLTKSVVKDEYDGYLAGFGPAIIISGLIQTIAVYEATEDRKNVLDAIATVANIENSVTGSELLSLCLNNHNQRDRLYLWREKIINASVALKIMIRTYNLNR